MWNDPRYFKGIWSKLPIAPINLFRTSKHVLHFKTNWRRWSWVILFLKFFEEMSRSSSHVWKNYSANKVRLVRPTENLFIAARARRAFTWRISLIYRLSRALFLINAKCAFFTFKYTKYFYVLLIMINMTLNLIKVE